MQFLHFLNNSKFYLNLYSEQDNDAFKNFSFIPIEIKCGNNRAGKNNQLDYQLEARF
jgi:hypothetical protein